VQRASRSLPCALKLSGKPSPWRSAQHAQPHEHRVRHRLAAQQAHAEPSLFDCSQAWLTICVSDGTRSSSMKRCDRNCTSRNTVPSSATPRCLTWPRAGQPACASPPCCARRTACSRLMRRWRPHAARQRRRRVSAVPPNRNWPRMRRAAAPRSVGIPLRSNRPKEPDQRRRECRHVRGQ
jgi:hypothetical protein